VRFSPTVCQVCSSQSLCTRAKNGARTVTFLPELQHKALQQIRNEQNGSEFQAKYAQRAGIEGTISQGVGCFELRTARYIGVAKTHLQMLAIAAAIDLHRLFDWWEEKPRSKTRVSSFARLAPNTAKLAPWWGVA